MEALAQELPMEPVPQGTILIQEGSSGSDAFVLASGRIDVYRATRHASNERVATLEPGRLFGVVALVHGAVRSASCYAAEPCWVVRLPGELYDQVEERDDMLAAAFRVAVYEALVKQLTSANEHVAVLIQTLANSPLVTEREREAFKALVLQTH
jgi:CRP-like cAMP-binding protein